MCGQPLQVNPAQKLDRPWTVLVLLFGATGVLGLPVLWASRSFSIRNKIVLSLAVTIYTAALVAAAWLAIRNAWNAWHEAFPTQ